MTRSLRLCLLAAGAAIVAALAWASNLHAQAEQFDRDGFAPINQEELALKDNPWKPGESAIILYRDVYVNGYGEATKYYYRIKIFKDEGKEYANVEIPIFRGYHIEGIRARTIHSDGKVVEFDGKPFDKVVVKGKALKISEKTFTLPDVQTGSVIEYRYIERWGEGISHNRTFDQMYIDSLGPLQVNRWIIDDELFTRHAHFALAPLPLPLAWTTAKLPAGSSPQRQPNGVVTLDASNIPAFVKEDYAPPEETLQGRVEFFYVPTSIRTQEDAQQFWVNHGKKSAKAQNAFIGNRKVIRQEVEATVGADDPPEVKLRKLYADAQKIRNLSYEKAKTEKEEKRDKLKEEKNVEDVLKHGYGYGYEVNALFIALARAAGFDAYTVLAVGRARHFFNPYAINWGQLDSELVEVNVGSKKLYVDPATRFCPFGLLPWQETGTKGVRLDEDGGAVVTIADPTSNDAMIERKATLKWDDGTLSGKLGVSFQGQEALDWRLAEREEDEAGRRKELEDRVKEWLPSGATVKLTNTPVWDSSDQPLAAEFDLQVPNFGASTGRRLLLPAGVFQTNHKNPFQHATREHPIYFSYPWQEVDDIHIEIPKGLEPETLPPAKKVDAQFARYEISSAKEAAGLHIQRKFAMNSMVFQTEYYPYLRAFYNDVGVGDEQQLVLRTVQTAAKQ